MPRHLLELLDNRQPIRDDPPRPSRSFTVATEYGDQEYADLLKDLQSNILTSHGFDRAHYFFVRFRPDNELSQAGEPEKYFVTKYFLGMLAHNAFERASLRSAVQDERFYPLMSEELRNVAKTWKQGAPGDVTPKQHDLLADLRVASEYEGYWRKAKERAGAQNAGDGRSPLLFTVNVLLTKAGYTNLDLTPPNDPAFLAGMGARARLLNDPNPELWEHSGEWPQLDALVIVAYDPLEATAVLQAEKIKTFREVLLKHADMLFEETGNVLRSQNGQYPIEPFGFRDGISQPAFYESQRAFMIGRDSTDDAPAWDPAAPLGLVLCPDPHGRTPQACGSYFAFRKLEQDLAKFVRQSKELAGEAGAKSLQERLLGRKRNGDPLVGGGDGSQNNFDFKRDVYGTACPFHAHVRKANPRGDVLPSYDPKSHRVVRRSIPYGPKVVRDDDDAPSLPIRDDQGNERTNGIGLLFMCAQRDIATQFEHLQTNWMNKADHPRARRTAIDTVVGHAANQTGFRIPLDPSVPALTHDYDPPIRLLGGAYFFAPSIGFLRCLVADLLQGDPANISRLTERGISQ